MHQLIDMTPAELQWLSSHLGHDMTTHKKNYRLHPNSVEITNVGRLLMAVDCGRQHTREGIEFLVPYWLWLGMCYYADLSYRGTGIICTSVCAITDLNSGIKK